MSYVIDPLMKSPAVEHPAGPPKEECTDAAKGLLECLKLPYERVKSVRLKRVTVDIEFKEEDC
jgi:hypothetical protein